MVWNDFLMTGIWLSLAKNNDKIFMSIDPQVLVKNGSREFYIWQVR